MFVTVITPNIESRFDCDEVAIKTPVKDQSDSPEKESPDTLLVEIYKNMVKVKEFTLHKSAGYAVFFMNDQGQTVDSLSW